MPVSRDDAFEWHRSDARLLLVFDGQCGICTRFADWMRRHDRTHRVLLLPAQTPGLLGAVGLTSAETNREAWSIERDGHALGGAAALNRALCEIGGGWGILGRAYAVPGMRQGEDAGYRWFARHRGWFSRWGVIPACARPGARCTSDEPPERDC